MSTVATRFRGWMLATVLLSMVAYGLAERELGLLAASVVLATAGWRITERATAGSWAGLPRWLANLVLMGSLGIAGIRVYDGAEPVSAFCGFLASIIVLKLWERRETTDYGQILTLSLFLAIGATLTDNSLPLGVALLLLLPALTMAVMHYQLHAAWARTRPAPEARVMAGTDTPPAPYRPIARPLARAAAVGLVASVVVAMGIFLLIPRGIGSAALGTIGRPAVGRETGFSDRVDLGLGGTISESQTQVMQVRISSESGNRQLGGDGLTYYMRGAVLDAYRQGRWTATPRIDEQESIEVRHQAELVSDPVEASGGTALVVQRVTHWRAGEETPVFALWKPTRVAFAAPAQLTLEREPARMTRRGARGVFEYTVYSRPSPIASSVPARRGDYERIADPNVPEGVAELARTILTERGIDPDPATRPADQDGPALRAMETYLRQSFEYTLSLAPPPVGADPTEWFVTRERRGHCEYFASALALMAQSIGVQARVVTGYLAHEFDPAAGAYVIRESNAHAWVEARTGPETWRIFDGTPPAWIDEHHGPPRNLRARAWRVLDHIESLWNKGVVTFDEQTRARLFGESSPMTSWVRGGGLWGTMRSFRASEHPRLGRDVIRVVVVAVAGIAMLVALHMLVRRWWRGQGRPADGWAFSDPVLGRVHRVLRTAVGRAGEVKRPWEPIGSAVERAAGRVPAADAADLRALADALYRARFGPGSMIGRDQAQEMQGLARRVAASSRAWPRPNRSRQGSDLG